jgi:lysophospholipase L1-like esterase
MRRLTLSLCVVALLGALAAPSAVAASNRPIEYLALGDSLAFGWRPFVQNPTDPTNYVSYADTVAMAMRDRLANASCPGETSGHFIDLDGSDHGCGLWRFALGLPLHVEYATSQLDFVDAFLATHPKTRLITLGLGANDLGALRDGCLGEADPMGCLAAGMPGMLATLSANLDTIYGHIRNDDRYVHKIVGLTVYSPNYADPVTTWAVDQVNQVFVARTLAWGGIVADGFGAFAAASAAFGGDTCAAGLRVVMSTSPLTCDDHPSALGQELLGHTVVGALRPD